MAGRTNRPLWESSDRDWKPMMYKPNRTKQARNGTDSFLPSGAVEYRPDPDPFWRANGRSTMSGNGSSSGSGTVTGNGHGDGGNKYKGRATTPFGTGRDIPIPRGIDFINGGTPTLPPMSTFSTLDPHFAYKGALNEAREHGSTSGSARRPGFLSPFAPAYPSSTSTVAPAELAAGVRPLVSPPHASGNAPTGCNCLICSDSTSAQCFQCQLARQHELMSTAWEEQRTHLEQFRLRMESIFREETRISVDHRRSLWDAEKTQLKSNIDYLNRQIKMLGDENLRLRSKLADQAQRGEPISRHGSFQGRTPLVDGSPPPPMACRQSGDALNYRWPTGFPTGLGGCQFGFCTGACQIPEFPSPSPPGTSVPPPASAPPGLPSTRISMSPQPGRGTMPISPVFSPYSSLPSPSPRLETESPNAGVSAPVRSPKRPLSVIDVHELDPKLDGISLRASALRKTTFEEAPLDGSPPSKRRRSLSHDYYIITNLNGEDEEADVKKTEEDEDEERRLTMHAGYTPNHSPSLPPATASGPSQGSATPTASSVHPESSDSPKGEDRSVTLAVTEEAGKSSGLSYPDLSEHLRRVESFSSNSRSRGVPSVASGDAPLKGPLMIKNIPAQDELFLAALNERLEPISQGQDALPRAVHTPVAMLASLSAVCGGLFDDADAKQTAAPDNTDVSGTQSEADEEHGGAHVKRRQAAVRIKWPDDPVYGYDGTSIKTEHTDPIFFYLTDDEDPPVEAEASPVIPVKTEDSDDEDDARSSEPEVAIKFKSTSNFGAPFGRM